MKLIKPSVEIIKQEKYDLLHVFKFIELAGFGTFETRERAAREGRNPRTKETINIPASTVPVFKAGKEIKERVNK